MSTPLYSDPWWRSREAAARGERQRRQAVYRARCQRRQLRPVALPCPEHGWRVPALLGGVRICWACHVEAHAVLVRRER
jgi:hypothetical protein